MFVHFANRQTGFFMVYFNQKKGKRGTKKMTRKEIKEEIARLEERVFWLNMADYRDRETYEMVSKLNGEIMELTRKYNSMEGE